jgi:transposase
MEEITIQNLDHLGIVAGIVDELEIVETINEILGEDKREKISSGVIVKAIIINGLGFVSAPLYLFKEFYQGKAKEHLLGKGITAEKLTDVKIGKVLDRLWEKGLTEIFIKIGLKRGQEK